MPNEDEEISTTVAPPTEETTVTAAVPRSELTATTAYTTVHFEEPMEELLTALALCKGKEFIEGSDEEMWELCKFVQARFPEEFE